jgi:hypothetical protein
MQAIHIMPQLKAAADAALPHFADVRAPLAQKPHEAQVAVLAVFLNAFVFDASRTAVKATPGYIALAVELLADTKSTATIAILMWFLFLLLKVNL